METDISMEQTTTDVLEEVLEAVCKESNSVSDRIRQTPLLPLESPISVVAGLEEQETALPFSSYFHFAGDEKLLKIDQDVMFSRAEPLSRDNEFRKPNDPKHISVCGTVGMSTEDQYSAISSSFQSEENPFDECNNMIKKLLDTFDTDVNKENCVQLQDTLKPVSDSNQSRKPEVCFQRSRLSGSQSLPAGITGYCSGTKEINDQRYSCESFTGESAINLTESERLDDEIDRMVNEIISNNVEMLSGAPDVSICKNRNESSPPLHVKLDRKPGLTTNDPVTPDCSNNLAELKLNPQDSTPLINTEFNKTPSDSSSTRSVPPGWLNSKRRQRPNSTSSSRSRTRSDDFVYCGPLRGRSNQEDATTPCSTCLKLRTPEQASEIPLELLYSGIAVAPGVFDKDSNPLVIVLTDDIVWQRCNVGAISLAHFLLYLSFRLENLALILDCRNSTPSVLKTLLEALSIFRNNCRLFIRRTLLLSNDTCEEDSTFLAVLKSLFDCECCVLNTFADLKSFVDPRNLLPDHGGSLEFSQAEWVQSRLVVDSFVLFCENVRHNFARETASMTSQSLPETSSETRATLQRHHREMAQLLDDRQVTNLRERSQRILEELSSNGGPDSGSCSNLVERSFVAANDAISHFVRIADGRLVALEQHLMVKQFEESCEYIHDWYESNMRTLESIFTDMPDSFHDLRLQRAEFDDFYVNVVTEYAKYDCLLNEVEQLNAIGYLRESELTRRTKLVEEEVKELVLKMEQKKEEVEVATQMYKFIDQAYSWALEGMKFVALLNMSECQSFDTCQKMIEDFDEYMQRHPPIPEADFVEVQELCRRYDNAKCLRQCQYALQKCKETTDLFGKRRELIAKLKSQFKSANKKRLPSLRSLIGLDKEKNPERLKSAPSLSMSSKSSSSHSKLSPDKESIDDFSLDSLDCSVFDEQSSGLLSPSDSYVQTNEFVSKSNAKPARKILKKSLSMPGHEMAQYCIRNSSTPVPPQTIGSPVSIDEEFDRNPDKTKVALIIDELIATEKEYVKSLNYVIEHYISEMCKLEIPPALRCKRNVIFGNIERIAEFHSRDFLRDLENCNGNPPLVAKTFQSHKEGFGLYALYSKNKPQSDRLLLEHGNEFFKTKQIELNDKMDLASYLLKPVQRMGKYALLLHAMSKQCLPSEERALKEAEEMVKFQLRHGNDLLTMDSIQDCDVNLKEQGNLLRQEQFIIYSGRRKIIRRVFLFEDLILFSKPIHIHGGHDVYLYKCSYKTAEIGMTENIGDTGCKFEIWFRRRRSQPTQDTYVLQSSSRSIKRAWVDEIRGLLWKQALRNRNHRKDELSSMGVGNKPHLDLTESNPNRITDRSVITTPPGDYGSFSSRVSRSRTRVSIAVPTFEHVQQQSKRPHSTISTSSSTSSVGSGNNQNMSFVSSLNLASWPSKSDGRSYSTLSPPMAYFDFHVIAEDLNEDCETSSGSSITMSRDGPNEVTCKSPLTKQYVTTV